MAPILALEATGSTVFPLGSYKPCLDQHTQASLSRKVTLSTTLREAAEVAGRDLQLKPTLQEVKEVGEWAQINQVPHAPPLLGEQTLAAAGAEDVPTLALELVAAPASS